MTTAKPTKKKKANVVAGAPGQLKGKVFAFAGRLKHKANVLTFIKSEKGKVLDQVTDKATHLVVGQKRGTAPTTQERKATKLNQQGATIEIIGEDDFFKLLALSREEAVAILAAGGEARERWKERYCWWWSPDLIPRPNLRGADLRGADLHYLDLRYVDLDGANLREANLSRAFLHLTNAQLDGACLANARIGTLVNCSVRHADLRSAEQDAGDTDRPPALDGSDFTKANLSEFNWHLSACRTVFRDARMERCNFSNADLTEAELGGADLSSAFLESTKLTAAKLAGANLQRAHLSDADLQNADLTGADFRRATLNAVDLRGAVIVGANFTGAYLSGANLTDLDLTCAIGLEEALCPVVVNPGPYLRRLEKPGHQTWHSFDVSVELPEPGSVVHLRVGSFWGEAQEAVPGRWRPCHKYQYGTQSQVMLQMGHHWRCGRLLLHTVKAFNHGNEALDMDELQTLAVGAWHEAFAQAVPTVEERSAEADRARSELVELLRRGIAGVADWNQRPLVLLLKARHFRSVDLSKLDLSSLQMHALDFSGACFNNAKMGRAKSESRGGAHLILQSASLRNADLTEAKLWSVDARSANFQGAKLNGAHLHNADFREANFRRAQLQHAHLLGADLRGADFTDADLRGALLGSAKFDIATKFPKGFRIPKEMKWKGDGPQPGIRRPKKLTRLLDFDSFLKRLRGHVVDTKLGSALKMLKTDRFQLFSDVNDDGLVGVVKSQTNKDLLYSCRLRTNGQYACCTQNLHPCGGLQGSLCKHLLVLIVGLTKAGQLSTMSADSWVIASANHKPALDKVAMTDTFLRYKGAQAGEIDWRPTETIPEDYYAL
jgi:uncharacterized protein YjbI with pentapeptide repeats